jgi:Skp family chaperone for outer membrane proteins
MLYSQLRCGKSVQRLVTIVIAASFSCAAYAQTPTAKPITIGLVDKDKVVTSYPKAQTAAEDLKRAEDQVHKLIEDSNKQMEDAKAAHKPPVEIEGLQRRLQTKIDDEVKKIQQRAQTLETQLENEIDTAIKAEAASRKVDTVFMKQAVLLGGVDITDGVVKRLAPATATKTSAAK